MDGDDHLRLTTNRLQRDERYRQSGWLEAGQILLRQGTSLPCSPPRAQASKLADAIRDLSLQNGRGNRSCNSERIQRILFPR